MSSIRNGWPGASLLRLVLEAIRGSPDPSRMYASSLAYSCFESTVSTPRVVEAHDAGDVLVSAASGIPESAARQARDDPARAGHSSAAVRGRQMKIFSRLAVVPKPGRLAITPDLGHRARGSTCSARHPGSARSARRRRKPPLTEHYVIRGAVHRVHGTPNCERDCPLPARAARDPALCLHRQGRAHTSASPRRRCFRDMPRAGLTRPAAAVHAGQHAPLKFGQLDEQPGMSCVVCVVKPDSRGTIMAASA